MESFFNNSVVWFGIGFLFFMLEFLVPGFILFFFGIGAWIVGILTFFIEVSLTTQIAVFLASSILTVVLFRDLVKRKLGMTGAEPQLLEDEFIGKTALAETPISASIAGKVEFKGTSWDASSEESINAGDRVTITETRSILLIVKPIKTL